MMTMIIGQCNIDKKLNSHANIYIKILFVGKN